jgi:hypothetical protein
MGGNQSQQPTKDAEEAKEEEKSDTATAEKTMAPPEATAEEVPVVIDVSAGRRARQFMADDELAGVLCLVAGELELHELGRLMRTCRLAWAALSADAVWQAAYARYANASDDTEDTLPAGLTWKERTRRLTEGVRLDELPKESAVFVFGVWLVVVSPT